MSLAEASKKTQEEYLKLHFIPYLQSEMIPVFEASISRSNAVVKMSQQFPHLNFQIVEGPISSKMFVLSDTGSGLDLGNLEDHQSVTERHPNLVFKFVYLYNVDPFDISGIDGGK